ncbi:hypothetical protein BDZ97DRAFT_1838379, partial [Flammula alnicola]
MPRSAQCLVTGLNGPVSCTVSMSPLAWQFHAMQNYAINNNLTPFISVQNHYNLVYREEEREMFPTLNRGKV